MGPESQDVRRGRSPSASAVTIREADPRDAVPVAALLGELGYPSTPEQAAERLERIAVDPTTWLIVAESGGELAGLGALHVQTLVERDDRAARSRGSSSGNDFAAEASASC